MPPVLFATASTDLATVLGALAAVLAGVWAIVRLVLTQAAKDRDDDRSERQELVKAMKAMADSNQHIADETAKGNREARARNGHLGEQNVQIAELVKATKTDLLDAVQHVTEQHVVHQQVEKSDVADEHVKRKK